jgi:hypothetical protein
MLHPENATEFYVINVKKPPMDKLKVREAFCACRRPRCMDDAEKDV